MYSKYWDTDKLEPNDLSKLVTHLHACAHSNESNLGDADFQLPPTNHWSIFLQLGPQLSVRLDMTAGYGENGLRGKIDVQSKGYAKTFHDIKTLSFQPASGTTVKSILDMMSGNGLDKYAFTENLEGCRYWTMRVISTLDGAGILPPGSGQQAAQAMAR